MKKSLEIRLANKEDFDAVRKIVRDTINEVYPKYYPSGAVQFFLDHHSDESIRSDILAEKVFLIDDDGKTAGTVTVSENEIGRLFVLPDFQHRGYGKALLDFAEEKIAGSHENTIIHASLPAKPIYLKRGYREIDYIIGETGHGDFLCRDIMAKHLG
ncbi:MAG: GNAT family N-acetyltransferase [Treponema sp.]|nr:GNAT family N-acetyltransferase [Treponema sp.]